MFFEVPENGEAQDEAGEVVEPSGDKEASSRSDVAGDGKDLEATLLELLELFNVPDGD